MVNKLFKNFFLLSTLLLLSACHADKSSKYVGPENLVNISNNQQLGNKKLTIEAENFLKTNFLSEQFNKTPDEVIRNCILQVNLSRSNTIIEHNYRATLKVIIDLCIFKAREASKENAIKYWMTVAYFSYRYLFDDNLNPPLSNLTTPDAGIVMNYYNVALYNIFKFIKSKDLITKDSYTIPMVYGSVKFDKAELSDSLTLSSFKNSILTVDYSVSGLNEPIFQKGLGLPLATIPANEDRFPSLGYKTRLVSYYYPAVFFLRFNHISSVNLDISATPGYLDFYKNIYFKTKNKNIQLLNNFSVIVGKFSEEYSLSNGERYFFTPSNIRQDDIEGIYCLEKYNPKKIPIILIHGLLETPNVYLQLLNTMMQYDSIRSKYQFMLFFYATGESPLKSSKTLTQIIKQVEHNNNKVKPILIGNNLGGTIAKLTANQLNSKPNGDDISKVIYIDTPLNGNDYTDSVNSILMRGIYNDPITYFANYRSMLMFLYGITKFDSSLENGNPVELLKPHSKLIDYLNSIQLKGTSQFQIIPKIRNANDYSKNIPSKNSYIVSDSKDLISSTEVANLILKILYKQ